AIILGEAVTASAGISIANEGTGTLTGLAANIQYVGNSTGWLNAELSSPNGPSTLTITVDVTGLAPGMYRAMVQLTATSQGTPPVAVPVDFEVIQPRPIPAI